MSTTRDDFVQGLRALADALEADDGLPIPTMSAPTVWPSTRSELAAVTKAMLRAEPRGRIEKSPLASTYFNVSKDFGGGVKYDATMAREEVCQRRQVGTKTVTREEAVETRTVEVEEPVYEWDCADPILQAVNDGTVA